jgi:hypothetical protein
MPPRILQHLWARRGIRRYFAGELDARARARLFDHLRGCERCRSEFDAAATLLRAVAGRTPTRQELTRWELGVAERLDAPSQQPARGAAWSWLAPAAAAAAVVLVVVLIGVGSRPALEPAPAVQLRGAGPRAARPMVDIEVYAIPSAGEPVPRPLEDLGTVGLAEYLQFRYRNHDDRVRHLYLVGIDERLEPLDYFPRPDSPSSIPIGEALDPSPIPRSIKLAKRHQHGPLWIYGLFSERPLSRREVHERLRRLKVVGTTRQGMDRIDFGPGVFPVVRRLRIVGDAQ